MEPACLLAVFEEYEKQSEGYEVDKPITGVSVSVVLRFSSKFYACPRHLASRPNIHFWDRPDSLSVMDIISRLKGFIH